MSAYSFAVIGTETLEDVAGAYDHWRQSVDREKVARGVFRAAVSTAREQGAKLDAIAAQLGVTRQAIQKVLREVRLEQDAREAAGRLLERQADADLRAQSRGLSGRRNCFVCGRMKSRISDVCDFCGDDPVTHNGSRAQFDAAYAGGLR